MNSKIFNLILKNLEKSFSLEKYRGITEKIDITTEIETLPWTPVRYEKFKNSILEELNFTEGDFRGTIEQVVDKFDKRYMKRFFNELWIPRTEEFNYTGMSIIDEINSKNPNAVLDVGCGHHPFKGKIKNLIGIDPYNDSADYMVEVLEYAVENESYDHIIAFGSINFNGFNSIDRRFRRLVELLKPAGKLYFRANPGIPHELGPYIDVFPWTFEIAYELSKKYSLSLETFKKDSHDRLFFVFGKKENMLDQDKLNRYFKESWTPHYGEDIDKSHKKVAGEITDTETVLDVGCGYNPFKKIVKNLVGIDPAIDAADIKTTIEDFVPQEKFDVAICFGSINFGSEKDIEKQISKVVDCLKDTGRIYWRLNPGRKDHINEEGKKINFFPWTFEKLNYFAEKFNFKQIDCHEELIDRYVEMPDSDIPEDNRYSIRLYAKWVR